MTALQEIEETVVGAAEAAGPSVVGIGQRWGRGSGVVVAEGRVLTNAHNVRGDRVEVTFADGRTVEASVAGMDRDGDLAILSVDTAEAPAVAWAEESVPRPGSAVIGLSNPGGRGLRVSFGLVSGTERAFRGPRGRRISGSIEHTAPLPRGSSGGPIVDEQGRLLGINTSRSGDGFYLAIPADASLRERIEALGRGDAAPAPRLGVGIAPAFVARRLRRAVGLPEMDGLLVRAVEDDSPAERAGIEAGDLIVEAGGRSVASADDLFEALDQAGAGGTLSLKVVRGTEERSVSVDLAGSGPVAERA
ncbi:MAG TPA: S1C family serine protease [Actinomycetota bacterium]|nr:S1C family serine protease [Actinomycetota bacterium]